MRVLVADDDPGVVSGLVALVDELGFAARGARTLAEARHQLSAFDPHLVLADLVLPDGNGLALVKAAAEEPGRDVVVLTGHATVEAAVEAMKAGAYDFLLKPARPAHLAALLARVASRLSPVEPPPDEARLGPMVGRSAPMREVFRRIARVAPSEAPVFLQGESGTGKELAAQAIHGLSRRQGKPFVAVNCGALAPALVESELFGHEKGAFTGAERRRAGVFEAAAGGTLFLDEVTEMPPELQVKLLRVLESRSFRRVGGSEELDADVRVVSSTNRDVAAELESGRLRRDLYYRLDVFPLVLPPLRERPDDVAPLATHFLGAIEEVERRGIGGFAPAALERLERHGWPGNVRELRNVVHRCYLLCDPPSVPAETVLAALAAVPRAGASPSPAGAQLADVRVGDSLAEAERKLILRTLEETGGDRRKAAAILGVSLKTVYNKLKEYGAAG